MRRRPVYPSLTSWANREVPNLPVPAPESLVANTGLANAGFGDSAPDGSEEVIDAVVRYGVRAGASLVSGILRDPDVQRALLALITDVARQLMLPGGRTQESAAMDSGSSLPTVAVVGLSDAQAAEVSRAYRGVLRVLFDKGDSAASPTLRGVLADAQLVVVMDGTVSSEVMRMLRQETPRFVRHTTGLSGLRKRLADLVMDQTAQGVSSARISASRA